MIAKGLIKTFFKVEIRSDAPGRLRLKIRNFHLIPVDKIQEFSSHVKEIVSSIPGITSVEFNDKIGSILIMYDKNKTDGNKIYVTIDKMIDKAILLSSDKKLLQNGNVEDIKTQYMDSLKGESEV